MIRRTPDDAADILRDESRDNGILPGDRLVLPYASELMPEWLVLFVDSKGCAWLAAMDETPWASCFEVRLGFEDEGPVVVHFERLVRLSGPALSAGRRLSSVDAAEVRRILTRIEGQILGVVRPTASEREAAWDADYEAHRRALTEDAERLAAALGGVIVQPSDLHRRIADLATADGVEVSDVGLGAHALVEPTPSLLRAPEATDDGGTKYPGPKTPRLSAGMASRQARPARWHWVGVAAAAAVGLLGVGVTFVDSSSDRVRRGAYALRGGAGEVGAELRIDGVPCLAAGIEGAAPCPVRPGAEVQVLYRIDSDRTHEVLTLVSTSSAGRRRLERVEALEPTCDARGERCDEGLCPLGRRPPLSETSTDLWTVFTKRPIDVLRYLETGVADEEAAPIAYRFDLTNPSRSVR